MSHLRVIFMACLLATILAFSFHALASTDSRVMASGEGAGVISGWVVMNPKYQLAGDPSRVARVNFDLNGSAGAVSVKLNSNGTTYTACKNPYANHWQCDFPDGIILSSIDELRVIAVGK